MEDLNLHERLSSQLPLHLSDFGKNSPANFTCQTDNASQGSDSDVHILSTQSSGQLGMEGIALTGRSPNKEDTANYPRHPKETDAKSSALKALAGIGKVVSKSRRIDAEALEAIKAQRARNKAEGESHHKHSRTLSSDSLPPMPELTTGTSLPLSQCSTSTGATTPTHPTFHPQRIHRRSHSGIPVPPPSIISTHTSYPLTSPLAYADWLSLRTLPELCALQSALEIELSKHHATGVAQTPSPAVDAFLSAQYNAAFGTTLNASSSSSATATAVHHHQQQAEHAAALQQALAAVATGTAIDPYAVAAATAVSGGSITPGSNAQGYLTPSNTATTPTSNVSPLRQRLPQQYYNHYGQHQPSMAPANPFSSTHSFDTRKISEAVSFPAQHAGHHNAGYHHQRSKSHQLYGSSPLLTPDSDGSVLNASSSLTFASLSIDAGYQQQQQYNGGGHHGGAHQQAHQQSPLYSTTPEFSFLGSDLPSLVRCTHCVVLIALKVVALMHIFFIVTI